MLLQLKGNQTQVQLATHLEVTPQYLGDVLAGRREPGKGILKTLKLERVTSYQPVKKEAKK
jgi:hypothetical protein